MNTVIKIAKGIVIVGALCVSLSGCATLEDPEFLNALQGATQQLQNNVQAQQNFGQCMQTATTPSARTSCVGAYSEGTFGQ